MARDRPFAVLDVGTSKVLAAVGQPSGEGWTVRGVGVAPAQGIRRGVIVDLEASAAAIASAAQRAQRAAGERLSAVVLGVTGGQVACQNVNAAIELASAGEVGSEDVERVLAQAREGGVPAGHDLMHVIPRHYLIDGQDGVHDPRGLAAATLAVDAHMVSCHASALQNVWRAAARAGLDVADLALNALAAGEAVLLADERELGVALCDLGAGSTDVVVYRGGGPVFTGALPLGGDNVTSDLAVGLRTSLAQAEELKRSYGVADTRLADGGRVVQVPGVADAAPPREVPESEIAAMVAARVEEILEAAAGLIAAVAPPEELPAGVVLVGGMAEMRGVLSLAMRVFGGTARVGSPAAQPLQGPACAAAAGLLQFAAEREGPPPARRGLWGRLRRRG